MDLCYFIFTEFVESNHLTTYLSLFFFFVPSNVGSLAQSVIDLVVNSSAVKRKQSPTKTSPSKLEKKSDSSIVCDLVKDFATVDSSVKKEVIESDLLSVEKLEKKEVIGSDLLSVEKLEKKEVSNHVGKKKKSAPAKKSLKKRKKNGQKKSFADNNHFDIDPRLGGSKIKQTLSSKKKDKKSKSIDNEPKRNKVFEQRFPYIHVEGTWTSPSVVKIINGHVKVKD